MKGIVRKLRKRFVINVLAQLILRLLTPLADIALLSLVITHQKKKNIAQIYVK